MTKNEIISEIYNDDNYTKMLNTICPSKLYVEDLKQELFLILLQSKDEFIIKLHKENNLIKWSNKILTNQYHSNFSPFYKKYKRPVYNTNYHIAEDNIPLENNIEENIYTNDIVELNILEYVKNAKILNWAEYELFIFYYELDNSFMNEIISKRSYREIAKEFGLSNRVVQKTLDNIRFKLINLLKSDEKFSDLIDKDYEININKRIK